jgi:spore germination protein
MVILIAINAISSFAVPNFSVAIGFRLLAFIFLILASVAGLYGVMLGFLGLTVHLVTLKSFGVPYLSPIISFKFGTLRDLVLRAPLPMLKERPEYTMPADKTRVQDPRKKERGGEKENDDG